MMRRTTVLAAIAALSFALLLAGCGSSETAGDPAASQPHQTETTAPAEEPASGLYTPAYVPTGDEVAVITTSKGVIRVQLTGKDTPIHVGNFVELAQKGFYDGTKFHRYEPGFVIQGGDPQTRDATAEQVAGATGMYGTGGPGYTIKGEYTTNPNNRHLDGALGMARSQAPDSAGSQFYFCLGEQAFLDPNYTVFGQTLEGKDVIAQLRAGDVIESVVIENLAQ